MAHSFFPPTPANTIEDYTTRNEYFHAPSATYYRMVRRGARFFQVRWQIGFVGKQANYDEKEIDYIMGSGNHARTYLHRTPRGTLSELPLGWYAENGGTWAMSPGYDKPDHPASSRSIGYDCMFCHNAFPQIPAGQDRLGYEPLYRGKLPEGIDCTRCHGPGEQHMASAGKVAILNPAKLNPERQMEVCLQCHLQPTSFPLPNAIKRYERPFFSYDPAEPLAAFQLYFDKAKQDGRFEIAGSAYRLRQSACFLKSKGALQCTTCHNPHEARQTNYDQACRTCHTTLASGHSLKNNCASCHMPTRRTDDVVHVSVTDHLIARRPAAARPPTPYTEYRGPVVPYYPRSPDPLYLAIAQIRDRSNFANGLAQVSKLLASLAPRTPEPWFEAGQFTEALRRDPAYTPALMALKRFDEATRASPLDARTWNELRTEPGYRRAIEIDPDFSPPHNGLGVLYAQAGNLAGAETEFREAIRILPSTAEPHANLANLLALQANNDEALYEFEQTIRINPNAALARFRYAALLNTTRRFADAQQQVEIAIEQDANFAEAHELLGNLYERKTDLNSAIHQYRLAVRLNPQFSRAELDLGATLLATGEIDAAKPHLKAAAASDDPIVRDAALQLLEKK